MPVYINRNSNHSPAIIKETTKAIAKRTSNISSSKVVLSESISIYLSALRKRDFHDNITFIPKTTSTETKYKKKRKKIK